MCPNRTRKLLYFTYDAIPFTLVKYEPDLKSQKCVQYQVQTGLYSKLRSGTLAQPAHVCPQHP